MLPVVLLSSPIVNDSSLDSQIPFALTEKDQAQLFLLSHPPQKLQVGRPCTLNDGIQVMPPVTSPEFSHRIDKALEEGSLTRFVPAAGAASRLFASLVSGLKRREDLNSLERVLELAGGADNSAEKEIFQSIKEFFEKIDHYPFFQELQWAVRKRTDNELDIRKSSFENFFVSDHASIVIDTLLNPSGLNYAQTPKALIPFHRYPDGSIRTPLEEHLILACRMGSDKDGICRIHFTHSQEHHEKFVRALEEIRPRLEHHFNTKLEITFSTQDPGTDTLSIYKDDNTIVMKDGEIHRRPGGHGSLLNNLHEVTTPHVSLENIDNVEPDSGKAKFIETERLLYGKLLEAQSTIFSLLGYLEGEEYDEEGLTDIKEQILPQMNIFLPEEKWGKADLEEKKLLLKDYLDRPIRVAGVVPNTGEPGGGPFWVQDEEGAWTAQIVEQAEFDQQDERQSGILRSSTHFNAVRIFCGLRNYLGKAFQLGDYVNPEAISLSEKSIDGRTIRILENPGLWNGAMSKWITIFVQIEDYTPVKKMGDLVRPFHRHAAGADFFRFEGPS